MEQYPFKTRQDRNKRLKMLDFMSTAMLKDIKSGLESLNKIIIEKEELLRLNEVEDNERIS